MTVVGVVPAAGAGARLQPRVGSKEACIIGGRPVIGYLLERLAAGGVERTRVVVRPAKTDLVDLVASLGHEVVLAEPQTIAASVLAGLDGLDPDDVVLLGFPDSIWEPVDGFVSLRRSVEGGAELVLGLFQVDEPERSDVVRLDPSGVVEAIDIKPRRPASNWIWGCLVARAGVLAGIRPGDELSAFVAARARSVPVHGIRLGRLLDIGTRDALAGAETHPIVLAAAGPTR